MMHMKSAQKVLTFATSSDWKYRQAQAYVQPQDISLQQARIDLPESRDEDVVTIAKEKADYAYNKLRRPLIVIDGAFHIKALNDFPKTFVKFAEKYIGASGILKLMEGMAERSYEWPNVLYYRDADQEKYFVGYIRGTIINTLPNNSQANDFGLIQRPDGYVKTFSEMTSKELHHFETNIWSPTLFEEFTTWYKQTAQ